MKHPFRHLGAVAAALFISVAAPQVFAHGDVTPQAVDTTGLKDLGADFLKSNPYRKDKTAIRIGSSAYNQNCARCHGLEAVSGGIAPGQRKFDEECSGLADAGKKAACYTDMDDYYLGTVRRGRTRDGRVYMPPFEGTLSQEAIWAIRTYLEVRRGQ